MSESISGNAELLRSDAQSKSVFYKPERFRIPDDVPEGFLPPRDLVDDLSKLDLMRESKLTTAEMADEYIDIANRYGMQGKTGFEPMMNSLKAALEIRLAHFEPNDLLIGRTYRQIYNVSAGVIPVAESIDWLSKSIQVAEHNIAAGVRSPELTDYYMNTSYQRLASMYEMSGQKERSEEVLKKILK